MKCKLRGCSNRVAQDSGNDYCWRHRSLSGVSTVDDRDELRESAPELFTDGSLSIPSVQRVSDVMVDSTPMHSSYALAISRAFDSWNKRIEIDATIPENAMMIDNQDALRALKEELVNQGIDSNRITIWRFESGSRVDPVSGIKQEFDSEVHHALVMDRQTQREIVIDPSIAKYAPVYDSGQPVSDQLSSGLTPFGDSPWVGTMSEYMDGSFLQWKRSVQVE